MAKLTTIIAFLLVSITSFSQITIEASSPEPTVIGFTKEPIGPNVLATLYLDKESEIKNYYTLALSTNTFQKVNYTASGNGGTRIVNRAYFTDGMSLINFTATPEELEGLYNTLKAQVLAEKNSELRIKLGNNTMYLKTVKNLGIRSLDIRLLSGGYIFLTERQLDRVFGK